MEYRENDLKFRVKAPGELGQRVALFLRRVYPRKTADEVSAITGISVKTVATWLDGTSCPGGVAFARLTAVYGPDFLRAVLPNCPRWLDDAQKAERQRRIDAEIAALEAEREACR